MSLIGRLGFQPHDDVDADVVGGGAPTALALTAGRASARGHDLGGEDARLGAAQRWESFLPASSRIALLFLFHSKEMHLNGFLVLEQILLDQRIVQRTDAR